MSNQNILLRHGYIQIPKSSLQDPANDEDMATVIMNIAYYGYALSSEAYHSLLNISYDELVCFWQEVEKDLKSITGDDRKIEDFVVYKNFPAEVLSKTEIEYWIPQVLMYFGLPNDLFTEEVEPRKQMKEKTKAIVLHKAKKSTLEDIFASLLSSPAPWKEQEFTDVIFLAEGISFSADKISFKENLVKLVSHMMDLGKHIRVKTATDVLRLAAGLSDGDVSLREKVKFISFKKPMRRYLVSLLEECLPSHLAEDVGRRSEMFKRLFHQLHPGDYRRRCPNVCSVMDDLYNDNIITFNGKVEALLLSKDEAALELLASRPGEFRRRLIHLLELFGDKAAFAFIDNDVLRSLTTYQIVSLRSFLASVNNRLHRVFPPKGNWNKLQIGEARWVEERHIKMISAALGDVLKERVPKVKVLDENVKMIKLPNNGEVSPFTRGTAFPIPNDVEFIRTASYWKTNPNKGATWFDNGWNFFDENWKSLGSCCWNSISFGNSSYSNRNKMIDSGAIFSGDPVNSKEMEGRAAQLIDLYPAKLYAQGVRYAVWNILCFSHVVFADAEDVFAALQWGKDAQTGKLFEPSRCQLSFPLNGKQMTKYVCVLDFQERKMIYIDANLHGDVSSADKNGDTLEKNMPAFMEYIESLPSVHDLFCESVDGSSSDVSILYSDKDISLQNVSAYVFSPENKDNKYIPVNINKLLT